MNDTCSFLLWLPSDLNPIPPWWRGLQVLCQAWSGDLSSPAPTLIFHLQVLIYHLAVNQSEFFAQIPFSPAQRSSCPEPPLPPSAWCSRPPFQQPSYRLPRGKLLLQL